MSMFQVRNEKAVFDIVYEVELKNGQIRQNDGSWSGGNAQICQQHIESVMAACKVQGFVLISNSGTVEAFPMEAINCIRFTLRCLGGGL